MNIFLLTLLLAILLPADPTSAQTYDNSSRYYCFSGSTLYQEDMVDCIASDPTYNGTWYCAKMDVCEMFKPRFRDCITTKGCAKQSQCQDPETGSLFHGAYTVNGSEVLQSPAGMRVKPYCCGNEATFANDDLIAIDESKICNTGSRGAYSSVFTPLGVAAQILIATIAALGVSFQM